MTAPTDEFDQPCPHGGYQTREAAGHRAAVWMSPAHGGDYWPAREYIGAQLLDALERAA